MDRFQEILQEATGRGSRSTALQPLIWVLGTLVAGLVATSRIGQAPWIAVLAGVMVTVVLLALLGAYFFLLIKDRDALRSERYSLSKLAIEKSLTGDSIAGFTLLPSHNLSNEKISVVDAAEDI